MSMPLWYYFVEIMRYFLLAQVIILVSSFWLFERAMVALASYSRVPPITDPWGVALRMIKALARFNIWLSRKVRMYFRGYVRNYYPRAYEMLRILFQ